MPTDIAAYNAAQRDDDLRAVCETLAAEIAKALPRAEGRVWHGGPVWFLEANPIVGYWVRKSSVQLLFWSGQSFDEEGLAPEGKFKAAEARYGSRAELRLGVLRRWLKKAKTIQWDYANIVKRRGTLVKIGDW